MKTKQKKRKATSGVLSQDRKGKQLAGLDTSTEACGLIRGYPINLTYPIGVAWLMKGDCANISPKLSIMRINSSTHGPYLNG